MRHLDLFSGIGGFALAAQRVFGKRHQVVAFCEQEPFAQKVLGKHWPKVPIFDDVRTLDGKQFAGTELVTGGFPCQDLSCAGKQAGIEGERSGLWGELCRIISEVRPRYALVENVPMLLMGDKGRWFGRVLGDLAEIGFDAEWYCIPAAAVGAPHLRDRVWLLTYPRREPGGIWGTWEDANKSLLQQGDDWTEAERREDWELVGLVPGVHKRTSADWWRAQSRVDRSVDGLPDRLDRLKGLGNAIVPSVAQVIFKSIFDLEHGRNVPEQACNE